MFAEDLAGIDGHRAVEENRHVAQAAARFEAVEMKKQGLGPADRKRRNHDCSATANVSPMISARASSGSRRSWRRLP